MDRIARVNIKGIKETTGRFDLRHRRLDVSATIDQLEKIMDWSKFELPGYDESFQIFLGRLLEMETNLSKKIGELKTG